MKQQKRGGAEQEWEWSHGFRPEGHPREREGGDGLAFLVYRFGDMPEHIEPDGIDWGEIGLEPGGPCGWVYVDCRGDVYAEAVVRLDTYSQEFGGVAVGDAMVRVQEHLYSWARKSCGCIGVDPG